MVVDPTALFLFSHQLIGLSPDGGVSWLLPRIVGVRTASKLILTAARVGASEAVALGLASQLVDAGVLETEAVKLAERLSRGPRRAIRTAKRLMARAQSSSAADQLKAERDGIIACVSDADFIEGVRAFSEKRTPQFRSGQMHVETHGGAPENHNRLCRFNFFPKRPLSICRLCLRLKYTVISVAR